MIKEFARVLMVYAEILLGKIVVIQNLILLHNGDSENKENTYDDQRGTIQFKSR